MKYSTIFVAFFLLLGAINALPTQHHSERTNTCAKQCLNHENNLFKEIGSTVTLNYQTTSEIELQNGQRTQVHLKAKVDVATISKCEHQMQLREVQVDGPKEAEIMKKQLERHSTKFSQDNSRIESICFDENEETWVLNLKKAILSTMQVSVHGDQKAEQEILEKDVLGYTTTKYEQISSDLIKKTKFLSTSSKRSQSVNSFLTGDFGKEKKSTCEIQLDTKRQILKSVICEEINTLLPFAQSKASAHVATTTKLTFEKIQSSQPQSMDKQLIRNSLIFNKKHFARRQNQDKREIVEAAEKLIEEIRSEVEHNVQKETPEKIKKLSQKLAVLNVQELEKLAQKVSSKNDKVQDIFFDTVAQTGTQETAHIILNVILNNQYYNGEVSKVRTAYWLSMLSNVEQVTEEILETAAQHLKKDNLPRQAMLALTNMIAELKYDQEIKQDQRYQEVVEALVQRFHRQSDEQEKIAILKALRNTGVHHQVFDQVLNIAQQRSHHVETRIAAVQALEQHVNEERYHQKLMKIFENNSNEAELRISAFQVLVNNQHKVEQLFDVLRTESNKQVGSYVVSYLKNARKSQMPERETLRRFASNFDLPEKKFERNDMRQSRHIQFTQHIEKLDLGAQVEADLVFDEQKQLRNVRTRFELNKENLQLKSVEITVRQNGLPEFAQQMLQELTKETNLNNVVDEIKEFTSIRSKHELNQKINRLFRMLKLNKIHLNSKRITENVDASICLRVEDKTVLYLNMKDIQRFVSIVEQKLNQREEIVNQILEHLTGDNAITFIFADKQHKMPTHSGLPIHSGHSMVVVAGLKVENGAFYPSIATDLHYEMGFTMMNVKPAIHHHVQMHSAPGLKANVESKNGVPVKLMMSMPENRLEIISVRSKVHLQTPTEVIELNVEKKETQGSTKVFSKILGVELYYQTVYPRDFIQMNALNAFLNGPIGFSLHLQKTDSSIRHWQLVFETPFAHRTGEAKSLHIAFNTVGSNVNREVSAKIELQNENDSKIVHIEMRTPTKSAKIEGRAQWTQNQAGLKAALIMGNQQRLEAEISVEKINQNGEQQYRPTMKLIIPGQSKIHYTGKLAIVKSGKKENFQVELKDSTTNKHLIKASVVKSGRIGAFESFKLATDLQAFWTTHSSIRLVSNIQKDENKGFNTDVEIIHSTSRKAPTTYKWKLAMKDLSNNQNSKYNADFELNVPRTQFENVALSWNFANKQNEVETEFTGFWNNQDGQKTRQIHILQQLKLNKVSARISSLNENLMKIEIVPLSVNYEVQAKTNWQRSQQKYNVQLTARDVQTNKQYKGEMSYQMSESEKLRMNLEARIMIENNEFKISHNIEEQQHQEYHGRTMVQLRKGQHMELNYVYRLKEHSLQIPRLHHELDAEISVPSKSISIKHKSALKMNAEQFEIKHSLRNNNIVVSDVKIVLNKKGQSQIKMDVQKWFQVKLVGDMSQETNQKQIELEVQGKRHQINHQTKVQWSGRQQFKFESKTIKEQRQIAQISVDYLRNEKAEAKAHIEKLGELVASHQPNSQQWANVEIKSDYFSRPIRQHFVIEKRSNNRYTFKSTTHQNQQIFGELDLEVDSQSSMKVAAFDWKVSGKMQTAGKRAINLSLENSKQNLREEIEIELRNNVARVQFKHKNEQQHESRLIGQVSWVEESKLRFEDQNRNVEFSIKPFAQQKHIKFTFDDSEQNVKHISELKLQNSALLLVLEHNRNNQVVIKHETKLSNQEDSYSKTKSKRFTFEALYKRNSAFEVNFFNQHGLKHFTNFEIFDLRNQIGRIESKTMKNGEQILKLNIDMDSFRKINLEVAHRQERELKLNVNMKNQQKHANLKLRSGHIEINSKWNQESQKEQKYTLEIADQKHDSTYNLMTHYQRKNMLHIQIDGSRKGKQYQSELKLHKNGEALFRVDGENMKIRSELDFTRSQAEGKFEFENKRKSIKHETTVTFSKQENELKIKSKTNQNSDQITNVEFRINPTTKTIYALGKVNNKNLKIEGSNNRYSIELSENKNGEFKHTTVLDLNAKTVHSKTIRDNHQTYKMEARIVNRRDVECSVNVYEHELFFRTNQKDRKLELNYNNNKNSIRSEGVYTIGHKSFSVKINGHQNSRQVVDFETNLRLDEKSFDAKLNAFHLRSSVQMEINERKQVRAQANYENQKTEIETVRLSVDTINLNEKKISAQIHGKHLKMEKEFKLINGQELQIRNHFERNGQKVFQADGKVDKSWKINGKMHINTENLKIQTTVENLNQQDEMRVDFLVKNGQDKKIADLKSKIAKRNNKLTVTVDFESHSTSQYTLVGELKKESNQFGIESVIKSNGQQVGKYDGKIRFDGLTMDAQLQGELNYNGKKSQIIYKLNTVNKFEHVFKVKNQNYSYGYDIVIHLKQGKWTIHLPNRIVEIRYDVASQTNGHILVNLDILPNSKLQPNTIYNIKFDNTITLAQQEVIWNTKATINHPEIHHPIELNLRTELRDMNNQRPLVIFVTYDASSNQQNRISTLFEISNESAVRVAHLSISHQNQQILDIHYRWALQSQLVHQQLTWAFMVSGLNQQTQKQTGELLAQINLKQRQAKVELNNKQSLQINWESNFDRNIIVQIRAKTDNHVRKTKIMTNNKEKQIEITNYENERIVSNYVVSVLKAKNILYAIEMHKKENNNKLRKVAFIQLVKDSLNYAKVHMKIEKDMLYKIQNTVDQIESKARSVAKRHVKEISSIARQQYQNMRLDDQIEKTNQLFNKAIEDLVEIRNDYARFLQQYLPDVMNVVSRIYHSISEYLKNVWSIHLEEKISEFIGEIVYQIKQAAMKADQWKEEADYQIERMTRKVRQLNQEFNHEVVEKLSNRFEEGMQDAIRFAEEKGEQFYEFLNRNLRYTKLNGLVEKVREIIVTIKNQLKQTRVHGNLHKFYQSNLIDGKWNLREGEIKAQVYYPTKWLN